ncbi:FAD-dependent oxidoreductase [Bacillaceae bacterium SIJ1]|uniref:FAD-dependent oxidoreductase n=1 Tax=Litoribacterium kuwaitense TaxID=1398745 RepID=UPI0013ED6488|nr:FAD-dependent oxidoreductase [Litoribacterium kuwaitense]NGP45760.1 FAD-dependent oxidoreductase [Litoribacterium kuwaitense]
MKIAVIGCTCAGAAAVTNMLNMYSDVQVTIYEENDYVSFLASGIALHVQKITSDSQRLYDSVFNHFEDEGIQMRMQHEVTAVDVKKKIIQATNLMTGEKTKDTFDKLIITTKTIPIVPNLPGDELENIYFCENSDYAKVLIHKARDARNVVILGAGNVSVELAAALAVQGKQVTLIDRKSRILSQHFDAQLTEPLDELLSEHGVMLALGQTVLGFEGEEGKVTRVMTSEQVHPADIVISCLGWRPDTDHFNGQVDMLETGFILVDRFLQTSAKDVLAAGSCVVFRDQPMQQEVNVPLATNELKMGVVAAKNVLQKTVAHPGLQGTLGIQLFHHFVASTGMTEERASFLDLDVDTVDIQEKYSAKKWQVCSLFAVKLSSIACLEKY